MEHKPLQWEVTDPLILIQEKERQLDSRLGSARRQAAQIIREAKAEAEIILQTARREAREQAKALRQELSGAARAKVEKSANVIDLAELRHRGEHNLPLAVQHIIALVTNQPDISL